MLVLVETSAGYGLFNVDKKLSKAEPQDYEDILSNKSYDGITLQSFSKFKDTEQAIDEAFKNRDGEEIGENLKTLLKKNVKGEELIVNDPKLAKVIKDKCGIKIKYHVCNKEITRFIQQNFENLVEGIDAKDMNALALSLSHGMARMSLSFSPEKVDQMVIQAVSLIDDLDKESNTLSMRLKEWYGWHFPEVSKIITDSKIYCEFVLMIGDRGNVQTSGAELEDLVGEDVAEDIRKQAIISNACAITEQDLKMIKDVAQNVLALLEYKTQLADYLKKRMEALAPNLTCMVGELVAARLMAHAGGLMDLAKRPASTLQILGAEKALFMAIKQKKPTPKYGLIYHVSAVGQAAPAVKGSIARVLANKLALCARVDALGAKPGDAPTIGLSCKSYVESKLASLNEANANGTLKKRNIHQQPRFNNDRNASFNKRHRE